MTEQKPKRERGRPRLYPELTLNDSIQLRVTSGQRQEYDELGGDRWLRDLLDAYAAERASMSASKST